ncbi:MAG: hypothetical protein AAF447_04725 [Myxococcota bacterium]
MPRGCGDGYPEPGPTPPRELCDDGNTIDGDLCSADCTPTLATVLADPLGEWEPFVAERARSIAADGRGHLLIAYFEDAGTDPGRMLAVRLNRGGARLDAEPLIVEELADPDGPAVVGLAGGGWVVAYQAVRPVGSPFSSVDVVYRTVSTEGAVGAERTLPALAEGGQRDVRLSPHGDGFIAAWADDTSSRADRSGGIRFRRFDGSARPIDAEDQIPSVNNLPRESSPAVASDGTFFVVAFERESQGIWYRRYGPLGPLDAQERQLTASRADTPVAGTLPVAAGDIPQFLLAWREPGEGGTDAFAQRIVARDAVMLAEPPLVVEQGPSSPRQLRVAGWPSFDPSSDGPGPHYLAGFRTPGGAQLQSSAALPSALALGDALVGAEELAALVPAPDGVWVAWTGTDDVNPGLGLRMQLLPY